MSCEWREVLLGEHAEITTGFPFKSKDYSYKLDDLNLIRGNGINQNEIDLSGEPKWPRYKSNALNEYFLSTGDIVLAMDRPWIEAGLKYAEIREEHLPALLVQRTARLRGSQTLCTRFLKYVIASKPFTDYVLSIQTGTAIPHISRNQIKDFKFPLPPLHEQKRIAHILGSLDDKIELNRKMNRTLEAMARAIFKSWFIDFDPVRAKMEGRQPHGMPPETAALFPDKLVDSELGPIPEGWEVKPYDELVELISGGTPSTKNDEYWNGSIPWFSVRDAPNDSDVFVIETERNTTQQGIDNSSAKIMPPKTTIVSARGTVGKLALTGVAMSMNQSCYGVRGTNGYPDYFTYYLLKHLVASLQNKAHGTVFDTITRKTFSTVTAVAPSVALTEKFESHVTAIMEQILLNNNSNSQLISVRNELLRKLFIFPAQDRPVYS